MELLQLQLPTTPSQQGSGEDHEVTMLRSDHENVSDVASTLPTSSCDATNTIVSDTSVLCTIHDTPVANIISDTSIGKTHSARILQSINNPKE